MMRVLCVCLLGVCMCVAGAEEEFAVERDGVIYGAQADERGPIGGGEGYTAIVTGGDYVVDSVAALVDALAVAQAGEVVFIPGETEIDLTTLIYIEQLVLEVPEGVTLAGDRGNEGSAGALIVSDVLATPVMIRALGPDVRVTGLRIQGPNPKRQLVHHRKAFSEGGEGHTYYYKFPTQNGIMSEHDALEVDNCDISGFGHGGIYLTSGVDHHVHHCYIHHCQYNGLGYGISHNQASSLIERNLFDFNRHSIAGTGRPGCGYVASNNVELGTSLSHCFDMHGGRDRGDGTDVAGTRIEIHNNTFGAPIRAIAIRGVPEDICDVHHNWFQKHTDPAVAVRAAESTDIHDNACGEEGLVVQ